MFFLTVSCLAQNAKKPKERQRDTAFAVVQLNTLTVSKTLMIIVGQKAKVYVSGDSILKELENYPSNDFMKSRYKRINEFLDSSFRINDTATALIFQLFGLEDLVAGQLKRGLAKVYYIKEQTFVDIIYHRLERYGSDADRFFYLPDKRPFFFNKEMSGIIDSKAMFSGKYYEEYKNQGDKLLSLFVY
jgi:hypothetical protein